MLCRVASSIKASFSVHVFSPSRNAPRCLSQSPLLYVPTCLLVMSVGHAAFAEDCHMCMCSQHTSTTSKHYAGLALHHLHGVQVCKVCWLRACQSMYRLACPSLSVHQINQVRFHHHVPPFWYIPEKQSPLVSCFGHCEVLDVLQIPLHRLLPRVLA